MSSAIRCSHLQPFGTVIGKNKATGREGGSSRSTMDVVRPKIIQNSQTSQAPMMRVHVYGAIVREVCGQFESMIRGRCDDHAYTIGGVRLSIDM